MNYESTSRQRVQNSHDIKTGTIKVWFNVHDTKKWNRRWNKHLNSLPYVILRYIPTWHRMKLHDLTERHNKKIRHQITSKWSRRIFLLSVSYLCSLPLNTISWRDLFSRLISAEDTFMMTSLLNSLEKRKWKKTFCKIFFYTISKLPLHLYWRFQDWPFLAILLCTLN